MKILLVGNYENLEQQSMQRFSDMLLRGLSDAGHEVRLVRPPAWLGRIWRGKTGLAKWLGYIDRFLLYPPLLRRQIGWADVVHICDQANAVYVRYSRCKPHVVTCHDMLAIAAAHGEIKESRTGLPGRIYQRMILRGLRQAQVVLCVSNHTAGELQRLAGLVQERTVVVPNALNYSYQPMATVEANRHLRALNLEPARPFFLHVGDNTWYKNRSAVLRIIAELIKQNSYRSHCLVMAGKQWTDEMRDLAVSLHIQNRAFELVDVSSERLRALYSRAEALVFPSLSEGFGWPIIEAQACGCPVVTTNRPPMTEVGGQAAIYIDPIDPVDGAKIVTSALKHREHWRVAGLENVDRYSKPTMIEGYVRAYQHVVRKQHIETKSSCAV